MIVARAEMPDEDGWRTLDSTRLDLEDENDDKVYHDNVVMNNDEPDLSCSSDWGSTALAPSHETEEDGGTPEKKERVKLTVKRATLMQKRNCPKHQERATARAGLLTSSVRERNWQQKKKDCHLGATFS
jgi:hypothetical protein